jgi:hypothetical protein
MRRQAIEEARLVALFGLALFRLEALRGVENNGLVAEPGECAPLITCGGANRSDTAAISAAWQRRLGTSAPFEPLFPQVVRGVRQPRRSLNKKRSQCNGTSEH